MKENPFTVGGHQWKEAEPFSERMVCAACGERSTYATLRRGDVGPCAPEPTDDDLANGFGMEGGIPYATDDGPGSLGENDWRL